MNIKQVRKKNNKTLADVAAAIGSKPNTLCQYETGKREPNIETLKKLAEFFNCTVDELLK